MSEAKETLSDKALRIMRENRLAVENLEDPWQMLAFTLYTMLQDADEQIKLIPELPDHTSATTIEKWMHDVAKGIASTADLMAKTPKTLEITIYQAMKHALEHGRAYR